jgi:threonine dehydrogenase-like Zn-dependent dehydrogenase
MEGFMMKACVLRGDSRTQIIDLPIPEIQEDEVLVKVKTCGVCTSEVHSWIHGIGGVNGILGHEAVGTIEAIGKNVKGFSIGDRVTGLILGAYAEYVKVDYRNIVKVPAKLEDTEALGEPLSCLVSGAKRTPVDYGDTVAIIGTGFMGLGFLQLMKLKGAEKVIAIDIREDGLENALKFGADRVLFPHEVEDVLKVTDWNRMNGGVNVAVEVSGTQKGLELAGEMTAVHGNLSIVGYHQNGLRSINMELWNWKAITVINAHERRNHVYMDCMKAGLKLIASGGFNMRDMITHEFRLDEIDQAYRMMLDKPRGFIKSVIRI